jgi:hypothetical protein
MTCLMYNGDIPIVDQEVDYTLHRTELFVGLQNFNESAGCFQSKSRHRLAAMVRWSYATRECGFVAQFQ